MLWRISSVVIVMFWAVMTGLIIRDSYFPNQSSFRTVPPRQVFDLFLTNAAAFNNSLQLFHGKEKLGHTSFTIRKDALAEAGSPPVYTLLASGALEMRTGPEQIEVLDVNFKVNGELENAEVWRHVDMEVKSSRANLLMTLKWNQADKLPKIEVKQGGQLIMNTEFMKGFMAMKGMLDGSGQDWMKDMPKLDDSAAAVPLTAREGLMELAGKQRRCYIVSLQLMKTHEVRFLFTEAGELARIELPDDYRFIEPMMHGLEKGLNTLD